jgi:Na+-transporting methylmalonyl-CoA/oxaloacetate decarboxylase gamma subunit
MKVIGPAGLGVFFVVTVFLAAFLYKLGEWINSAFWSQGSESSSKSKKAN